MAVITGVLPSVLAYTGTNNEYISDDLSGFSLDWWPPHIADQSSIGHAPLTRNFPVAANGREITGFVGGSYLDDFYNRIHVIPSRLDLGNIVSTQTSTVYLWNAFFTAQNLLSVSGLDDGIELSGQPSPPLGFTALQEREYTVSITTDGPAVLEATVQWVFDGIDPAKLFITGNRIAAFAWRVDWTNGVRENLAWATDVMQSRTGKQQRRKLRQTPRRNLSADLYVYQGERQFFDIAMFGWAAKVFAVPVWYDIQTTPGATAAGSFEILCDTVNRDFRAGGLAILLGEMAFQYETVEILSLTSTKLVLKRQTINNWPAGSLLYPVRTGRMLSNPKLKRLNDQLQQFNAEFQIQEPSDWPAVIPATMYRGWPVYDAAPDESEDLTSEFQHLLLQLDNGIAAPVVTDTASMPFFVQLHRWVLHGRAERAAHRSLLYALAGRLKPVWIPTHADDLTLANTVTSLATVMDVNWLGYTRFSGLKPSRRDIRVHMRNGTVYYRRITGTVEISATVERLQIDSAFGATINPADVFRISWLMLMCGESDTVEIQHINDGDGCAESQQVFKAVRDEL